MFKNQRTFARRHIVLTAVNHAAAGFGLALVLQHSLVGNAFLPVTFGWLLLAFAAIVHAYEWTR